MGRFDEWLTDELSQKQEEPANESTQAETATTTEENTGSVSEAKPEHFISFSNLEASISSVGADSTEAGGQCRDKSSACHQGNSSASRLPV